MYKDIAQKIAFHRERIIKEFVKRGIYPSDKLIEDRLSEIDTSLSYLQSDEVVAGEVFNTPAFNTMIEMLYKDLELLYQLLYEVTVKEYVTLKAFVDTHLDDLENTANLYKLKAEQEANSTSLGKTILFKNSGFDFVTQNNITVVDLGPVNINNGSRIACFMNANNIEPEKVVFGLQGASGDPLYVSPYNYNQDSIVTPGELTRKTYPTTFKEDQVLSGSIEMDLGGAKASEANRYTILAGKNKILVKAFDPTVSQFIKEMPTKLDMASFPDRSYIDFYVVGGNSITFRFNKQPISTNFITTSNKVSNLNHIHHFFIECESGFSFDFELDGGTVYAIKENGIVSSDKVFFSRTVDVRDFLVEEYLMGSPTAYRMFAKIVNDDGDPIDIESVMVKELVSLGGAS